MCYWIDSVDLLCMDLLDPEYHTSFNSAQIFHCNTNVMHVLNKCLYHSQVGVAICLFKFLFP